MRLFRIDRTNIVWSFLFGATEKEPGCVSDRDFVIESSVIFLCSSQYRMYFLMRRRPKKEGKCNFSYGFKPFIEWFTEKQDNVLSLPDNRSHLGHFLGIFAFIVKFLF